MPIRLFAEIKFVGGGEYTLAVYGLTSARIGEASKSLGTVSGRSRSADLQTELTAFPDASVISLYDGMTYYNQAANI